MVQWLIPTLQEAPTETSRLVFTGGDDYLLTLRARADDYFAGRPRRDDPRLYRKAAIVAAWFIGSYALALTARSGWIQVLACLSYALAACALGFNIFHDAVHGSFSASAKVNLVLARITCVALGAGRKFWWYKHNILHHSYTNVFKWDDDLETRDSLRLSPEQPWKPKYRYQHLFFVFLYGMTTLEWMFVKDFVQYFTGKLNPFQELPTLTRSEKIEFWLSKAGYFAFFVVLPFAVLPAWKAVAGLLLFHFTLGVSLAAIFNLAHAMERAEFPVPAPGTGSLESEWAVHQMLTTVNFANKSRALNWFSGGLNFQIEHHLFPQICHTHYPALSAIVKRTALEFGLPYNDYPTYLSAVKSHYRILKSLALPPSFAKPAGL